MDKNIFFGTTYSHTFASYLQLDHQKSFREIIALKFDYLRLCCYWNEIQPAKNTFDFSNIQWMLDECEKHNQKVVLTVGMKAPRYPEFFIPSWASSNDPAIILPDVLLYIEKTVQKLKHYNCIKYWQVENEPLDPSGPKNISIDLSTLTQEVELIKRLDKRPIVITTWGNELSKRKNINKIEGIADIIGIDLYYKQFITNIIGKKIYKGPSDSTNTIKKIISSFPKPFWITELQAEPWEESTSQYKADTCNSMNIDILQSNIEKASAINIDAIFLWGSEYWLWRKHLGDNKYYDLIKKLLANN